MDVEEFVLDSAGASPSVTLVAVSASRPWLELALQRFAVGRAFPIPPAAAQALRLLV